MSLHSLSCSSNSKESVCNAGDPGSIPGSGRSSGEGNGNPPQYSCLENPVDRGAWRATVCGITKSQIQLTDLHYYSIQSFQFSGLSFGTCCSFYAIFSLHSPLLFFPLSSSLSHVSFPYSSLNNGLKLIFLPIY